MRTTTAIALTGLVAASVTFAGAPAQATSRNHVTINTIPNRVTTTGDATSTALVQPGVSWTGIVRITRKRITVTKNGTTVVSKVPKVRLAAGVYRVTTYVRYKTYVRKHGNLILKGAHHNQRTQTLIVDRRCATQAEYDTLVANQYAQETESSSPPPVVSYGTDQSTVTAVLHTNGVLTYSQTEGQDTYSTRIYSRCDSDQSFYVGFMNGHADWLPNSTINQNQVQ